MNVGGRRAVDHGDKTSVLSGCVCVLSLHAHQPLSINCVIEAALLLFSW